MPRQTISFSEPNHSWLAAKLESKEFKSNSEAVNDALRRVRDIESGVEAIRNRLIKAEMSGFTELTPEEILKKSKEELRKNGQL